MYNCLVLEDTLGDQLAIEMILDKFSEIEATYVSSPRGFLQELSKKFYQIYIVDIMLNDSLTGIDLIHSITDVSAWVIISSSMDSKDYYEEYKTLKFNKFFVSKPIDEFVFKTNIESFLFNKQVTKSEEIEILEESFIMLKQGNYLYKVLYSKIMLIETSGHATTVHTQNSKYTTYNSLKSFEELLADFGFEKANRNTLVNINAIKRVNVKEDYIEINAKQVRISRSNRQFFIDKYMSSE